jgi:hypothetical protein
MGIPIPAGVFIVNPAEMLWHRATRNQDVHSHFNGDLVESFSSNQLLEELQIARLGDRRLSGIRYHDGASLEKPDAGIVG